MANIPTLLRMLQSGNPSQRYEACEELRVAVVIPEEALVALHRAAADSDPSVADAATRALALHEVVPTPNSESASRAQGAAPNANRSIPDWISLPAKGKRLLGIMTLIALLFLPLLAHQGFGLVGWFFLFPEGLVSLLPSSVTSKYGTFLIIPAYLLYLGILVGIVISKNRSVVRILFAVLIVILLLNVGGCYRGMWNFVP